MRTILSKHGIPTATLADAVAFLNDAPEATVESFNAEFGLTPDGTDILPTARFAVDAIFRGADTVDKVVGYVAKRMIGVAVPKPAPVVMVGSPIVDTPDVVVAPVVVIPETAPVAVKGRRGRKRLGNSDMCKAVAAIEAAPKGSDREALLNCIIAQNIKRSSAVVYLWRYNKGERE